MIRDASLRAHATHNGLPSNRRQACQYHSGATDSVTSRVKVVCFSLWSRPASPGNRRNLKRTMQNFVCRKPLSSYLADSFCAA